MNGKYILYSLDVALSGMTERERPLSRCDFSGQLPTVIAHGMNYQYSEFVLVSCCPGHLTDICFLTLSSLGNVKFKKFRVPVHI